MGTDVEAFSRIRACSSDQSLAAAELRSSTPVGERVGRIAARLPVTNVDIVFAGRLCMGVIGQALIEGGFLSSKRRVVDFDDLMSRFRRQESRHGGVSMTIGKRISALTDAAILDAAERRLATGWDACSVSGRGEKESLQRACWTATVAHVPNVVAHRRLPPRAAHAGVAILFVGNLRFGANTDGLITFVEHAWPEIVARIPHASLTVVGMNPPQRLLDLAKRSGFELVGNAPSLEPYYQDADIVIAPILFGTGTRIKLLEAMAYGRPIVSTSIGASGLDVRHDVHLLIGDGMAQFARAVCSLASDEALRSRLAEAAHDLQQRHYSPKAMQAAVSALVTA